MQNIKLVIPGSYYDSQIYSGRLYLWTTQNSIVTIDWDRFVYEFSGGLPEKLRFAAHSAFRKSSYLYGEEWRLFMQDIEMKDALLERFAELSVNAIVLDGGSPRNFTISEQDNPFSFPHADTLFYYGQLYAGSRSGMQVSSRGGDRFPISPNALKIWDGPVVGVSANFGTLALASGSDGLFEYDLPSKENGREDIEKVSPHHSTSVRWLYASLFSSSYRGGYLADYELETVKGKDDKRKKERSFLKITSSRDLFLGESDYTSSYSWGVHDKLCLTNAEEVRIIQYSPVTRDKDKPRFLNLGSVNVSQYLKGEVVNGDSALFGYIIETDEGLLVIDSQMKYLWLEGEPVNWRVFPETTDYTNQLHVIYEDRLEIYSFYS